MFAGTTRVRFRMLPQKYRPGIAAGRAEMSGAPLSSQIACHSTRNSFGAAR